MHTPSIAAVLTASRWPKCGFTPIPPPYPPPSTTHSIPLLRRLREFLNDYRGRGLSRDSDDRANWINWDLRLRGSNAEGLRDSVTDLVRNQLGSKRFHRPKYKRVVDHLLANLVKCDGDGLKYYRNRNQYQRDELRGIGVDVVVKTVECLANRGLVRQELGYYDRQRKKSAVSLLHGTQRLESLIGEHGVREVEPPTQIELLVRKGFPNDLGPPPQAAEWIRELQAYNELLAVSGIQHPKHRLTAQYLYRVFNGNWDRGGRFYGGRWQNLAGGSETRSLLSINGDAVVELDYGELHLRMLYAEKGVDLGHADPYIIGAIPRKLMKTAALTAINANNFDGARGSLQYAMNLGTLPKSHSPAELLRAFADAHPQLHGDLWSGAGIRLQRRDSEIMRFILHRLTNRGILALPVHDSALVATQHQRELEEVMRAAYLKVVGFEPQIERKQ